MRTLRIAALSLIPLMLLSGRAHAYLDAGTGSYVVQVVIASMLGAIVAIKAYWKNIKVFFVTRILKRQPPRDDN